MIQDAEANIVLIVENVHTAACGRPPRIRHTAADDSYVGFFANCHGEQWVVTIDSAKKIGTLYGGDIGWDQEVHITDGKVDDLILGREERQWLDACWQAACGEPLKG